ncbi:hypothetical protein [Pontibacter pudoricolor]|uniref:hypothetical protein n=1 Tax=Pontibacter pudoricolor TaxID=2694930 RepID=UPI0013914409|nr:hypothetical protein [Pontibacter pudoricolor]
MSTLKTIVTSFIRLLGCYSYIFHWNDRSYKVFTPLGSVSKNAELRGNKKALLSDFWKEHVIEVSSSPLILAMRKGDPVLMEKVERAEEFINHKLQIILSKPGKKASSAYNFNRLYELCVFGLNEDLLKLSEQLLSSFHLPVTASHGDLHINNMILVTNEIKLIDWSMYNPDGSFVNDYIHFYNYLETLKENQSWTVSILKEHEYLKQLAKQLQTTDTLLKLSYAMSRINGEIGQYSSLRLIPKKQINKYNNVLFQLVTLIERRKCLA